MKPLYLSPPGVLCALGNDAATICPGLFAGSTAGMVLEDGWLAGAPARVGRVTGDLPELPRRLADCNSRNNRLLLAACQQIEDELKAVIARFGTHRVGVILGTSTSGIAEGEAAIAHYRQHGSFPAGFAYNQMDIGNPAVFLAAYFGLVGPAYTVSTACTSGAKALVAARNLIRTGFCDAVVTGGVDTLCRLTVSGFTALESTTPEICLPLSRHRSGINIGEGAAVFILSRDEGPVQFLGAGESSDAHHISAPEPQGRGAQAAMEAALQDAGVAPSAIGYLNLHATATPKNDAMESLAVTRVFPDGVAVSGSKPMTGHTLGAAGALEAAFCWFALTDPKGSLPPHVWDDAPDPALPALAVVRPGQCFAPDRPRLAMSNSFAFGGNNVSLILGASR